MKILINELLKQGKAKKHVTYDETGIVYVNIEKISGSSGKDVNLAYIYPNGEINIVTQNNILYGYGKFKDGKVYDNSNRSVFKII